MNQTQKVLVVDDEPQVRNALTRLVREASMTPVVAASAEEALALSQGRPFAAVITDVRMPGMGGLVLLQNLSPLQRSARFLVVTGAANVDPSMLPRGHSVRVIRKPWDNVELVGALRSIKCKADAASILPPPILEQQEKHVLLVEDLESDARLFCTALRLQQQNPYVVTVVRSLAEARQALRENHFDVGCVDLSLPDCSGLDAVVRLQAEAPDLGFIVLSHQEDEDFALRAVQSGAQDYLVKGQAGGASVTKALKYAEERKRVEIRLSQMAFHDQLTGLPNRTLFRQRIAKATARSARGRDTFAVLLVDLDRFKAINDGLGHDAGDSFLQLVAERLRAATRSTDTVARLGGDEFAILAEPISAAADVDAIARKIVTELRQPTELNGRGLSPSASVGAAVYAAERESADELLACADAAMYAAKSSGRNNYQVYGVELQSDASSRLELEDSLRRAAEAGEFMIWYQPQVSTLGDFLGAEALLRWRRKDEVVGAERFISVMEDTGLITELNTWVLNTVFSQFARWKANHQHLDRMAVNLSAKQFSDSNLALEIERIAARYSIDSAAIELEITESTLLQNTEQVRSTLRRLRQGGFRIALDDFGTGFSSLSYLESFPISTVKIDRSFTRDVARDNYRRNLVGGIINLAGRLELDVIAEGVESEAQKRVIEAEGCDFMQGYFFGRAMSALDFEREFLQTQFRSSGAFAKCRTTSTPQKKTALT